MATIEEVERYEETLATAQSTLTGEDLRRAGVEILRDVNVLRRETEDDEVLDARIVALQRKIGIEVFNLGPGSAARLFDARMQETHPELYES